MKNPLTPAGIEPATFRFVAQHLDHCATAVPSVLLRMLENLQENSDIIILWTETEINKKKENKKKTRLLERETEGR